MIKYFLILCLAVNISFAHSYYFDSRYGSDNNNGLTKNSPFLSISKLNNINLKPGDFVYLKKGSKFFGAIEIKNSGTINNYITIESYGDGNRPQIDADFKSGFCISLENVKFVTVKSISLLNNIDRGNIYINKCSNIILDGLDIYVTAHGGVFIENSTDCLVKNCDINTPSNKYDKQTDGIYLQRNKRITIDHNEIIISNEHEKPHNDGIQSFLETDLTVCNNYIEQRNNKTNSQGIYSTNSFGVHLYFNNIVYCPNTKASVLGFKNMDKGTGALRAFNNTLVGKSTNMIYASEANDVEIMNNIIISTGKSSLLHFTENLKDYSKINNNFYNRTKNDRTVYIETKDGIISGSEWQEKGADTKSIFTKTSVDNNFIPLEENLVKGKGEDLSKYFDYDKDYKKRMGRFDIGAIELN
ncbi:MAG: right-handed parallel beta-helix repeat-containing protein [Syntrophothermus sp.]